MSKMVLFIKSHISAFTRKDGTFVAEHEDSRRAGHTIVEGKTKWNSRTWEIHKDGQKIAEYGADIPKKKVIDHHFATVDAEAEKKAAKKSLKETPKKKTKPLPAEKPSQSFSTPNAGVVVTDAKYGVFPHKELVDKNSVDDEMRSNSRVVVHGEFMATIDGDMYSSVKKLRDGGYLVEQRNPSHVSKNKEFWAVGRNLDELIDRVKSRTASSERAVKSSRVSKIDKELRSSLESRFGRVFEYDISNAKGSSSFYIKHKPSGIKIRVSDHDLPGYYENSADIDVRSNDAKEIGDELQRRLEDKPLTKSMLILPRWIAA